MKAKELAKLLDGVNPEAEVYIDLGVSHDKTKALIYEMLNDCDCNAADVEHITMTCFSEGGAREVYLCPYDGQYCMESDETVDAFFKEHGLDKVWEEARAH